jgi:hypothetical protein
MSLNINSESDLAEDFSHPLLAIGVDLPEAEGKLVGTLQNSTESKRVRSLDIGAVRLQIGSPPRTGSLLTVLTR